MITTKEAQERLRSEGTAFWDHLREANILRERHFGNSVRLCAILNAKSGACSEDCRFCAQSRHNQADTEVYPLMNSQQMLARARVGTQLGAIKLGIVTSGSAVRKTRDLEEIRTGISTITGELPITCCASLGMLKKEQLQSLKEAGLRRYHHNIETAPSHFSQICTTHPFEESVLTVQAAQSVGLEVCCGGIFGMGESVEQQFELLQTVRELNVDSVPLNFLSPIPGTPLEHADYLTPRHCLRIIALARIMMPTTEIRIAGGRERNLRQLQPLVFFAGANGMMVGGYLTLSGAPAEDDLQMIRDLGLTVERYD